MAGYVTVEASCMPGNIQMFVFQPYSVLRSAQILVKNKAIQSPHTYLKDYINGVFTRNNLNSYNITCLVLTRYARWCYEQR